MQHAQQLISVNAPLHDALPREAVTRSRRIVPCPPHGRHGSAAVPPSPSHASHAEIKSHRGSR